MAKQFKSKIKDLLIFIMFASIFFTVYLWNIKSLFSSDPNDMILYSAYKCDIAGVKQALMMGAKAWVETPDGQTVLMFLARCGDTPQIKDIIAELIARGAPANLLGHFGNEVYSACDIAILFGNKGVANLLNRSGSPCRFRQNL